MDNRNIADYWNIISKLDCCERLFLLILIISAFGLPAKAQVSKFPVYAHLSISPPAGLPLFKSEDFKVNPKRLALYSNGFLYGDKQTLEKLSHFLINDSEGQELWKKETNDAAKILNQWDFERSGFGGDRYVYRLPQLGNLSMVYLFSGHKELGQFIRGHVLLITELPFEFWLHAELRGYKPEHPTGGLETSSLCTTLAMTMSATADLYSSSERKKIDDSFHDKGFIPCLNWLEKPGLNNWTAVVSSGAYVAAKYFNDQEGMEKALKAMTGYLNGSVEEDGSYGEGVGYFNYPVKSLLPAILVMTNDERIEKFSASGLRYSASWETYPYLYATKPDGRIKQTILHFGDNSYLGDNSIVGSTDQKVNLILASLYNDPLAGWLFDKFKGSFDFQERLLLFSSPEGLSESKTPEQAKLPLVKVFNGGDSYIRSTWKDDGIVMAMWSGDGSRCHFSHQRPELGSICLGAYSEYLIVSSGSASYRSALHYQWDKTTKAANTITIDDKNQLFPGSGQSAWNQTDISGFWEQGDPKAEIVQCKSGKMADLLVNELAQAYHVPMKHVRRSILFVRDPGFFVVVDKIEAVDSQHKYSWRVHLNNKDGSGNIKKISNDHWRFTRPAANLDIYLFADKKLETNIGKGYMHGTSRDYSPGGINEGKPGSSIELVAFNREKAQSLTYYSVLYPSQIGVAPPAVKFAGDKIFIGKEILTFSEGECTIEKKEGTEKYKLWE